VLPSVTKINFLNDVTGLIQAQINLKADIASPTFTGTVELPNTNLTGNFDVTGGIQQKGIFNVINYGAVGDSITDDLTAIQLALNAANTNGGGIVYMPKGIYWVETSALTIYANTTLQGAGEGLTKIMTGDRSSGSTIIIGARGNRITIQDLTIDGNGANVVGSFGINNINGGDSLTIRNVTIKYTDSHGIYLNNSDHIILDNVKFYRNGVNGGNAANIQTTNISYLTMTNCILDGGYQHNYYMNTSAHDVLIENSYFINSQTGQGLSLRADSNVIVRNCVFRNNFMRGIQLFKDDPGLVSNVLIEGCTFDANNYSYQISISDAVNVRFINNEIYGWNLTYASTGVGLAISDSVNYVEVSGNRIQASYPIMVNCDDAVGKNVTISNNILGGLRNNNTSYTIKYGIDLYATLAGSENFYIFNNVIDSTATTPINIRNTWLARETVIKDNYTYGREIVDNSTASDKYVGGMIRLTGGDNIVFNTSGSTNITLPTTGTVIGATGGSFDLGTNNLTLTGDIGASGSEVNHVYTDTLTVTNSIDISTIVPMIHSAAGDTSNYNTPDKIGDLFIDTSASKVYVSVEAARGGWVILNVFLLLVFIRRKRK